MEINKDIILIKEGFVDSVLTDISSFSILTAFVYFNNEYCGGSWFLNAIFSLYALMMVKSLADKKSYTIDEAYTKIKQMKKGK